MGKGKLLEGEVRDRGQDEAAAAAEGGFGLWRGRQGQRLLVLLRAVRPVVPRHVSPAGGGDKWVRPPGTPQDCTSSTSTLLLVVVAQ